MVARHLCWCILCSICPLVAGKGIMLLYQPLDISNDCVFSTSLRYDLSFGMGLSDTISLVGNFNYSMSVHLNNFRKTVISDNFCAINVKVVMKTCNWSNICNLVVCSFSRPYLFFITTNYRNITVGVELSKSVRKQNYEKDKNKSIECTHHPLIQ